MGELPLRLMPGRAFISQQGINTDLIPLKIPFRDGAIAISLYPSLCFRRMMANRWMTTMSLEDFEKGRRDGRMGVYQPPYQRVFGPRSTCTPKEIEQAREDYRRGYMIGEKERTGKDASHQKLPGQAVRGKREQCSAGRFSETISIRQSGMSRVESGPGSICAE